MWLFRSTTSSSDVSKSGGAKKWGLAPPSSGNRAVRNIQAVIRDYSYTAESNMGRC